MDAAELKDRGNQEYKAGKFVKALELYSKAIETLESNDNVLCDLELLSKTYWNRSVAHISLNRFIPALRDAETSYSKFSTCNWKACLRAAQCCLRTADLAAAIGWIEQAKQQAPYLSDAAASNSIHEMEESIDRKRHFMSGGRFANDKLTKAFEQLEACIDQDRSYDDIPFLIYRIRTILRAYSSKIEPDCQAYDVGDPPPLQSPNPENMMAAYQRMALGIFHLKTHVDVPLKFHVLATKISTIGDYPNVDRLAKLMRTPGMEDLLFSDLPDVSPEHRALVENHLFWERQAKLGKAYGPRPAKLSEEERDRLKDTDREDMAAESLGQFTVSVLVELTRMTNWAISKRAFSQLGILYSTDLYRESFSLIFWTTFESLYNNSDFIQGLVAGGGLPGLASEINGPDFLTDVVAQALGSISTEVYLALSLEDVVVAVEKMGNKVDGFKPNSSCDCCRKNCSQQVASSIAHAFVKIYKAHGDKPFRRAARLTGCVRYYVSRMWPEEKEEAAAATATGAKSKPYWIPSCCNSWVTLFYKWGRMHPGKQSFYVLPSTLPSQKPTVVQFSKENNLCGNSACDGSRAKFAENGLRKLKICSGCRWTAYCSKACQVEGWPQHQELCGHEEERGRAVHERDEQGSDDD